MFTKAFRVKSNTVLKGSAKRKLKSDIAVAFPLLSAEELSELVPNKEELNVVKVYAHKGESVTLYVLHKNPLLFELDKRLYPTVYMLWRFPNVLPAFTTWPAVLQKMVGGADLMLPGVVIPSSGLPDVRQGDCCGVKVVSNRAPMAVGTSTMSSTEMLNMGMKGKGVSVIHTYMDQLWAFGDKSGPPSIPDAGCEGLLGNGEGSDEDEEEEGEEEEEGGVEHRPAEQLTPDQHCPAMEDMSLTDTGEEMGLAREEQSLKAAGDKDTGDEEDLNDEDQKVPQEELDALLVQCFLHALKTKVKKSELPLLTSTFLRKYMFSCCPNGKQLDIRRSSYKKLSRFLQSMQQQHHLVQVKELSKGVESIVEVDWRNPQLLSFQAPEQAEEEHPVEGGDAGEKPYHPPEITSLYSVSARLEPLFLEANKRKGSVLHASDVRLIITEYVKNNQLVCEHNKNYVTINPALCDCLLERTEYQEISALKWDELFSRTLSRMQQCYQLAFPGQAPVTKKGQIEPIDISVASRGSNKKVTLIKNLELYGLDPVAVSSALRHRVQASSVLQPLPGAKDRVQVQIQGSQIQQVGNLLLDQYKIPRKFIQGLDKAPKGGKKK